MADQVEELLREYTTKLRAVFRSQLEEDVTAAVRKAIAGSAGDVPKGGRTAKGNGSAPVARVTRGRKAGKRTPGQIAKLREKLLGYIGANPGQRAEEIARATKLSTSDISLPIKKLLAEKKIKSTGVARGTAYTATK